MRWRIATLLLLLLTFYIVQAFLFPYPQKNVLLGFRPSYGTTYSFEQAGWYGYDGRSEYINLLDEVKFDWIRLPIFWDQVLDNNGEFNKSIEDIEFAISEAQKRNVKVVIVLGAKTPYYPEYHLPPEQKKKLTFGEKINVNSPIVSDLITFDRKVVSRLSKYENISHWQIENEPYLANVNNWKIERDLIADEVKAVRDGDKLKRKVILNHVGPAIFDHEWTSLKSILGPGDAFGVNAYFKTQGTYLISFSLFNREVRIPWPRFLTWPVQSWHFLSPNFEGLKNEVAKKNIEFWVLEMQAEPYIRNLEDAKSGKFAFKSADISQADQFLRSRRIENVGLWGANFWIYRKYLGDTSWISEVKAIVN